MIRIDPDETLKTIREHVAAILDPIGEQPNPDDCEQLALEFESLDRWLMRGGFLPKDWQDKSHD